MSLIAAVARLKPEQVKELVDVMLDACIVAESGGGHKETFRRAKNRRVGTMRKMYARMETATPAQIDRVADRLLEDRG